MGRARADGENGARCEKGNQTHRFHHCSPCRLRYFEIALSGTFSCRTTRNTGRNSQAWLMYTSRIGAASSMKHKCQDFLKLSGFVAHESSAFLPGPGSGKERAGRHGASSSSRATSKSRSSRLRGRLRTRNRLKVRSTACAAARLSQATIRPSTASFQDARFVFSSDHPGCLPKPPFTA